ncbi:formate hydrogenlyase regulator HycA [Pseudocitrobacter sp. RIT415]|uniref:formate hydrogenlyase regulator HycA n=1 Tax=Pseudocitrobacter sp. RIT415 TaxID=2202163 RepID=UPI000D394CE3|nr:formate hydrogenlyase regulator HycA [Pseudocitrobacter sp. RIT 415]RAU49851.1 formate hydrogenlyase regulator HycA [Pseudocitrobacter sp. RIT 415]
MTIWEISEKADFIADRHHRQQEQWRIYCNSLVQGITLSKARLHHAVNCAPDKDLSFVLFEHFVLSVSLVGGFNSHTIEYTVETRDGQDKKCIARAELNTDGTVDNGIKCRDREQVLEHYLEKIAPVYDALYAALESDSPVTFNPLAQSANTAKVA